MFKKFLLISCICLGLGIFTPLMSKDITLTASVNKTAITMEDEITLTVRIDGAVGNIAPQLPSMPAFNVFARSSSQQINNFHSVTVFDYVMMPRFPGRAVIGPITLNYGNKVYSTDPIDITIFRAGPAKKAAAKNTSAATPAATSKKQVIQEAPADMPALERKLYNLAARQGHNNYFMVAAVDNDTPYVNQTILLAVRFYYLLPFMGNAPYTPPSIDNLFMEDIGRSEGRQKIGKELYAYTEMRYAITGVTVGDATIGPAVIKYVPGSRLDLSMFDRVFAAAAQEPQTAQSNEISLQIRSVPTQGQPKTFYGAVGSGYSISASLDRNEVEAGEAVNLSVKVNGTGNLKPTADLQIPSLAGFKVYDVVTSSGVLPSNGTLKSYKIFKTVLVPTASGTYIIPSFAWSYYDPQKKEYLTIRTDPLSLSVTPSTQTDSGFDFGAQTDLNQGFRQLNQDIHYLKSQLFQPKLSWLHHLGKATFVSYFILVLLFLTAIYSLLNKKNQRAKKAFSQAKVMLKKAHNEEAISDAISAYLQAKYQVHTASLPLKEIVQALQARSCPTEILQRFEMLWKQLEAARFAPVALQNEGAEELAHQALALLKDIEKGENK